MVCGKSPRSEAQPVNDRVIDVDRWEDAVAEIEKIKAANASNNPIWFRGQSKACWKLTTTLERFQKQDDTNFVSYYRHVVFIKPEIEAVTGLSWVLNEGQLIKWVKDKQTIERLLARERDSLRVITWPISAITGSRRPCLIGLTPATLRHTSRLQVARVAPRIVSLCLCI
jgi:hypothetical protein